MSGSGGIAKAAPWTVTTFLLIPEAGCPRMKGSGL